MVFKKVRTFAVPFTGNTYSFTMEYEYDSWGRILKMTYPDGEEVSYDYDHSGNLFSMAGVKNSTPYHYINSILYDRFGNRSRTDYGDQSHTEYKYDDLQRLTGIRTTAYNAGSEVTIQDIDYTFDNVGNISDADNNTTATGTLGGSYSNHYEYDDLDRLVYATQSYGTGNTLSAAYSGAGRLCEKEQSHTGQSAVFGYDNNRQPHAPRRIFDIGRNTLHDILWDRNGNMGQANTYDIGDGSVVSSRQLFWTEDNRLASVVDDHYFSYYTYDHSGERVLKMTGTNSLLDINADLISYNAHIDNITLYTSPYLVANNHGYTKHYYAGTERVCARLGNGNLDCHSDFIGGDANMVGRHEELFFSVLESMPERWLYYNNLENIREGCGNTLSELVVSCEKIGTSARVETAANTANFNDAMAQYANITQQTEYAYFYHGDHLGSASWITDDQGIPVQHLQYLPFGEPFVNQRASGSNYNERFTFTGKEKDAETAFSYFGARYYDSDLSGLFLSIDPMADKYPNISPYAYCAWNPMKLVDPNGEEAIYEDDIVIKGKNNSSLTIKTSTVNITVNTDRDFCGNHVVDASSGMFAFGYEIGGDATGSAGLQSSGSAYMQSVMFLGGDYSNYWYDFYGGEAQMNVSNSAEGTVGIHKNWFIGFYSGSKRNFKPSSFAGRYYGVDVGLSGNVILSGVSLDGSWAISEDGKWNTISLGYSLSVGPQFVFGSGVVGLYGGGNIGGTRLVTPEKKTAQRSFWDRFVNFLSHIP